MLLDKDLAGLCDVTTGNLNKAVTRNLDRFPDDFMFTLSPDEMKSLTFQSGISSWGGTRKPARSFTEQGVAMLSSVLHTHRAVQVNEVYIEFKISRNLPPPTGSVEEVKKDEDY